MVTSQVFCEHSTGNVSFIGHKESSEAYVTSTTFESLAALKERLVQLTAKKAKPSAQSRAFPWLAKQRLLLVQHPHDVTDHYQNRVKLKAGCVGDLTLRAQAVYSVKASTA